LLSAVDHHINGDPDRVQSHVMNISFRGVDSEALMLAVRSEVAISNGSACSSAGYSPSHVLKAMGLAGDRIAGAVRISWGQGITVIPMGALVDAVRALRG
jgi:cysteine desulfurase